MKDPEVRQAVAKAASVSDLYGGPMALLYD